MGEELHSSSRFLGPGGTGTYRSPRGPDLKVADIRPAGVDGDGTKPWGTGARDLPASARRAAGKFPGRAPEGDADCRYCREDQEKQEGPAFLPAAKF